MSVADKLTAIAENLPRIYQAGEEAERVTFWEAFQDGGQRNAYIYAFRSVYWTDDRFHPRYPIKGDMQQVFISSGITDTKVPIVVDGSIASGFQGSAMRVIRSLDLTNCTSCSRAFYNAANVESITFVGAIKVGELNLSYCPKLDKPSLLSLLDCLETKTDGGVWEVTLGSTNKAKLTAEELAIATQKGWTVK